MGVSEKDRRHAGRSLIDSGSMVFQERPTGGPVVEIDASPLYELLLSLLAFSYARRLDRSPLPCPVLTTQPSAEILQAIDEVSPSRGLRIEGRGEAPVSSDWIWNRLLFLAWELRARRLAPDVPQFLGHLQSMPPQHLSEYLFADTDPTDDSSPPRVLPMAPSQFKDRLLMILGGWYAEQLKGNERNLAVRLANDARTKRIIGNSAPTRLLQASAVGIHYLPRRLVTRVVLIPSVVCRPSTITIRYGSIRIFFYPIADDSPDHDSSLERLAKVHQALADVQRLRILRSLIATERTAASLSRELGQSTEVIREQLIVLRDAGLVVLRMDERRISFEIRKSLPSMVFRTLQAFLR